MSLADNIATAPGRVLLRGDVAGAGAYAVFDCETTGTSPERDEMVSLALIRLDPDGVEQARFASLLRPACSIPSDATAIHGIGDDDVAAAPTFDAVAGTLRSLLDGAVFVAHNAEFDLAMLQAAFARAGMSYRPADVACTVEAFRVLDPLAPSHSLEPLCERHGVPLQAAHDAEGDASASASLLRLLLAAGIAPETARLDLASFWRVRSRGDTRPASAAQIRRVFGLGFSAGLDREGIVDVVARVAGVADPDELTREQVQLVFDELESPDIRTKAA
jgi:DNA polymerase III epsilon subunit family exonuclease